MKYVAWFLLGLGLMSLSSHAGEAGVVTGLVGDPNGSPMSGVKLTMRGQSGDAASGTSDNTGHFRLAGLTAGDYVLVAQAEGFKQTTVPIQIGTEPVPAQILRMKLASVSQELTVSAAVDPVTADGNNDGFQVESDLLKSLPIKDGNPLAAAALFLDPASFGAEGPRMVVDGVETSSMDVPETSIKRVFVNKNPYSAEFSRPGKSRIEVMTKPGSNHHFHKRLVYTLRDSALDSRNAYAKTKPAMQRNFLETELDGPLPGHKGTFYLGGEYLKDNQNSFVSALTPAGVTSDNVPSPQSNWSFLGRTDLQLTAMHTLSLRYGSTRNARLNQGIGAFNLRERGFDMADTSQEFRIGESAMLSPTVFNEIRLSVRDRGHDAHSLSGAAAMLVPGAFQAGGAQVSQLRGEKDIDLQDVANVVRGMHTFRIGGGIKRRTVDLTDRSNFGGTYTFGSLADYLANRPLLFTISEGNPAVAFKQTEVFTFVQDEMRLGSNVGLLAGLRHSFQSNVSEYSNFAPRLGLSWSPGGHGTVFRAGAGIFYDRQPLGLTQQAAMFDAAHIQQVVIPNPRLDVPLSASDVRSPSLYAIAGNARMPYLTRISAGVEQKLGKNNYVSVEYAAMRGYHLYRLRNINAPLPGSGMRPRAEVLNLDQFESSGILRNQGVTVTFRTAYRSRFELLSQYTLSRTQDDTAGILALPADNYDLHSEFGRSDFDRRHRVNTAAIVRLPRNWKLGLIGNMSSGLPYNITTGFDNNGDTVVNDRPAGVARNTGKGPAFANADVRLSRRFYLNKESQYPHMEIRFDAFNVFNHLNATNYVGTLTSPIFGQANSALPPRQLQASLKFSF